MNITAEDWTDMQTDIANIVASGVPNASTTTMGGVEIATDAEVLAGIDTGGTGAKLVATPSQIKSNLDTQIATRGAVIDIQTFTSSGTWTLPSGAKKVVVELVGNGGGGSASDSNNYPGCGGSGGAYSRYEILPSWISSPVTITIPDAANGGSTNGQAGSDGGDVTFGTYFTGYGGTGGTVHGGTYVAGVGGAGQSSRGSGQTAGGPSGGGSGTSGYFAGGGGGNANVNGSNSFYGGGGSSGTQVGSNSAGSSIYGGGAGGNGSGGVAGGTSKFGGAGGAGGTASVGSDGAAPGGGGGGGGNGGSVVRAGGKGAKGQIIVTTYF